MNRREFIGGLGIAAALPVVVWGQQTALPVIGFLNTGSPDSNSYASFLAAFRQGLKETGYIEGQNAVIEFRWADGQYDRTPAMAADLVRRQVAVISAGGAEATIAAEAATTTIPIVFTVGDDAVKLGLVASLNRPGGNATGVNLLVNQMESKRLGLLRELVPKATMIAVLMNSKRAAYETQSAELKQAACCNRAEDSYIEC